MKIKFFNIRKMRNPNDGFNYEIELFGKRIKTNSYECETDSYEKILAFLKEYCHSRKTINRAVSSYGLKGRIETIIGSYASNYDVKKAMAQLGFDGRLVNHSSINYYYPVSMDSYRTIYNLKNSQNYTGSDNRINLFEACKIGEKMEGRFFCEKMDCEL